MISLRFNLLGFPTCKCMHCSTRLLDIDFHDSNLLPSLLELSMSVTSPHLTPPPPLTLCRTPPAQSAVESAQKDATSADAKVEDLKKQLAAAQQAAQEARARQRDAKGKLDSTKSDLSTLEHDISSRVRTPCCFNSCSSSMLQEKQRAWLLCAL